MKKTALFAFALWISICAALGGATAKPRDQFAEFQAESAVVNHDLFAAFLSRYAAEGADGVVRVDYGAAKTNGDTLGDYIASLETIDPTMLTRDEAFVYWANLYNAVTVALIIEHYPVKSIRSIKSGLISIGPWGKELVTVNGAALTLNNIEHDILRAIWKDPRIHYAVNCASIGCPNLLLAPWRSDTLDEDLDAAARAYINHPRGVSIDEKGRITASTIFRWYSDDFGADDAEIMAHWRNYAESALHEKLAKAARIDRHEYDWSLNDTAR